MITISRIYNYLTKRKMIVVKKKICVLGIRIWTENTESNYPIDINNIKVQENERNFEGTKIGFKK